MLERGKHLDVRRVADIGQHLAIGAQLRRIDDESGAVDAGQIELSECARIAGSGFHFVFRLFWFLAETQREERRSERGRER